MRITVLLLALLACTTDSDPVVDGDADTDADSDVDTEVMRSTISGEMTWNVDFDATAEAAGATDCAYTRHYEGVQDATAPWLCAGCDSLFGTTVEVVAGLDDCYAQVTTGTPATEEWIGIGDDVYYRGGSLQGSATTVGTDVTVSHFIDGYAPPMGGTLAFTIEGAFTIGEEAGDPMHGIEAADPSTCGWSTEPAAEYTGDYVLARDAQVPDGLFVDHCGEYARLHDFSDRYLVIDISAIDCPPCQSMAAQEGAFVASMADEGIEVEVITLLAPSLSDTAGTPTQQQLTDWVDNFELHSPVLGDRGWGLGVARPTMDTDYAYPTSIVVRPDGTVIDYWAGFSSFDPFADMIRTDAQ
jgi:hypothetical protein